MAAPVTLKSVLAMLRKDAGIDAEADRLHQLAWMVFLKALDDRELEQEILDERYVSPIPDLLRWRSFGYNPLLSGDALLAFVNDNLIPRLAMLPVTRDATALAVVDVFRLAKNWIRASDPLRRVIDALDSVDLNHLSRRRAFQAEFGELLGESAVVGLGQSFTPQPLARFIVEMLDPELGEKILDPTCGSGAFLVAAVERLRDRWVTLPEHETQVARSVSGATRDELSWLLSTTNMLLHGVLAPAHVVCDDLLARPFHLIGAVDRADVLVSVPPFGGRADLDVASNFPVALRTTDLRGLHIQQALHLLRPEGRGALVLPDGALFSDGIMTRIREKLLEECDVHTIVRLPMGVFAPFTTIRSNIVFFTRGRPTKEIWYYDQPLAGDLKAYSKKNPLKDEDFDALRAFWNRRTETESAFRVSIDVIKARDYMRVRLGTPM